MSMVCRGPASLQHCGSVHYMYDAVSCLQNMMCVAAAALTVCGSCCIQTVQHAEALLDWQAIYCCAYYSLHASLVGQLSAWWSADLLWG